MDIPSILEQLTREEKAALVAGTDFMYTSPVPRLGIPSVRMSDGPHGLRVQQHRGDNGTSDSEPATCFPTAATLASGWNTENVYRMGRAMGEECRHFGIHVVLGPGVNIKRNPLGGRNFEYFSEDPYLAGAMGTAEVRGIQSEGAGTSVKHFALNNSENYRFVGDSVADMRAIREIYLRPFEMITKDAHPETVMCAYNKLGGSYCGENAWLLTDVLRREWGFDGLVMTDWGATHDRLRMLRSGLDLEMPGDTPICRKWIVDALERGELDEAVLDEAVKNVLTLIEKHRHDAVEPADFEAHHRLAKELATDCAVLLKNEGALPLDASASVFVCGELFEKMRYQGAGSSMIRPAFLSTPKDAFDAHSVHYTYARGYRENGEEDSALLAEALAASAPFDSVLVFAGLTDYAESESIDRDSMALPQNQLRLIDALLAAGKRVTAVLFGGSPVELPFADRAEAILQMYLPGQAGGEAVYDLLFGLASPSGRLAETWPMEYAHVPFGASFGKTHNEVYKESVFVGYRYYLTAEKPVRYPFGYGLSYTTFAYDGMTVEEREGRFSISCRVTNTGTRSGAEVVQLYVTAPAGEVFRPLRELKAFAKVYLAPGESRTVELAVECADLRYWNMAEERYVLESGRYCFALCSDCQTVLLSQTVELAGESATAPYTPEVLAIYRSLDVEQITDAVFEQMAGIKIPPIPPALPIHMESRLSDLRATFFGRILYAAVMSIPARDMRRAKRMPEGVERDNTVKGAIFFRRILDSNSLITMSMAAGRQCPYHVAECFVHLAGGHILRALGALLRGTKAPPLPKDTQKSDR